MFRRSLLALFVFLIPGDAYSQVRLLRHPTYSNGRVAFSYLGDIWTANEDGSGVQRLTDNKARDVYPRYSPDGRWIAFSSNREGNYDVFVVAADGGRPRQLTFHSANDLVVGWTPDGKDVVFDSARGEGAFPTVTTLYKVGAEGGMEQPIPTDWGSSGSYSPDGARLAFTRHPGVWSRQHYRGNYAADLWLMDVASKKFTKLGDADYKGNYLWPMYARNGDIYFVADRIANEKNVRFAGPEVMKSVNNIWKISEHGGAPVQVTHHTSGNLYFPSISADGRTIVYEESFGLWKLDTASGKSSEIRVNIKSDEKDNGLQLRTVRNEAESFSLSPSNKRAAIATHGEIFSIATDKGEVQRVTESFWREQDPQWSPDGRWIAYISDRTGRQEVWISDELGKAPKQVSDADCDKTSISWAPDSASLLWAGSDHKLRRTEVAGKTTMMAASDMGAISAPQFAPDGKWVSYSKLDAMARPHVYVKPLDAGAERMIGGEDFLQSSGAKWTADGKKLLLLGGVGVPSMAALNRTSLQLYSVSLTRIEKGPDEGIDTEAQAEAAAADPALRAGVRANGLPRVDVKIEWDGLDRRIKQLTNLPGSVMVVAPAPDSRTYAFMAQGGGDLGGGGPALYTIGEDGTRLNRVQTAVTIDTTAAPPPDAPPPTPAAGGGLGGFGEPQWARDSRSLYYLQGRNIYTVAISAAPTDSTASAVVAGGGRGGGRGGATAAAAATPGAAPGATPRRIPFTVHMEVDEANERRQVFEEAWRVMKNRFYDAKMHGVNWAMAKDHYESLLPYIADVEQLHDVIMEMIGELNASHTGITGGGTPEPGREAVQTRYPGFDLAPDASGYYKVSWIYRKGPADHDYVRITPGNFILAVNGREVKTTDNYWHSFNLVTGSKFEFTVNSAPRMEGAWTVRIDPLTQTAQSNLDYERWVEARKAMVAELSKGQIGYLHIKAMDAPSLAKFQRDLVANLDKKALIIDQRFNGGGGIDQELLAILSQHSKYESFQGRDSVMLSRPNGAFLGPMAVLQNERSASDAEMFPEGFRALGLGKIVGVTTMGAVIGTGAFTMMDGSTLRTPGTGVFGAKGQNLENYGVPPDVWVDNGPEDFLAGHDRQVEKAVEVLAAQIK